MLDFGSLMKKYNVEIVCVIDNKTLEPKTKITFSDGHIINIKIDAWEIKKIYMFFIEEEIKEYNYILRSKKLERICND